MSTATTVQPAEKGLAPTAAWHAAFEVMYRGLPENEREESRQEFFRGLSESNRAKRRTMLRKWSNPNHPKRMHRVYWHYAAWQRKSFPLHVNLKLEARENALAQHHRLAAQLVSGAINAVEYVRHVFAVSAAVSHPLTKGDPPGIDRCATTDAGVTCLTRSLRLAPQAPPATSGVLNVA